jgi:exopolysaccharide biosynthesis polyprenyl glycosylphosphotransferase
MLSLTRTPSDELALAAKRLFDITVSFLVLFLLSPVFLAVAAAIKLDSPGPVFFRQRRVGLQGRTFDIFKLRSMYLDAEARLESLRTHNEMSGPVFKMKNDPRITRVGRFLRRTSLDEFPQFWNVLRGEMSVVGPRPPLPSEVRQYKRWQRRRLSVKPGITCIWQISGRNNIDFDRWMELDLEYIDQWSLWTDFQICLKTIPAVLGTRGAH